MLGTWSGGGCDTQYLRDAVTKGYIQLSGRTFTLLASKVPLSIETDRLRLVKAETDTEKK